MTQCGSVWQDTYHTLSGAFMKANYILLFHRSLWLLRPPTAFRSPRRDVKKKEGRNSRVTSGTLFGAGIPKLMVAFLYG